MTSESEAKFKEALARLALKPTSVNDFGAIDVEPVQVKGPFEADGSRIDVPTRSNQHHDKSQKGIKPMSVSHEPTKDEINDLWFNQI